MSSDAAFRVHLAGWLCEMGYRSCPASPVLWLKEQTDRKFSDYHVYILCYVDNLLAVHHNHRHIIDRIHSFLPLKLDLVGPSNIYLRAKLKNKTFEDDKMAWRQSPSKCDIPLEIFI